MEQVRIPIVIRGYARALGLFGSVTLIPATLACAGFAAFAATRDLNLIIRMLIVALLLVAAVKVGGLAWLALRLWLPGHAELRLTDGEMIVEHRGVFARPLVVPRQGVGSVAVASGADAREGLEHLARFLMAGVRSSIPSGIASWRDVASIGGGRAIFRALREGVAVPLVGLLPDIPNVAVRLRGSIALDTVWPGGGRLFPYSGFRTPQRGEQVGGLLLRVADAEVARAAFAAWGVLQENA